MLNSQEQKQWAENGYCVVSNKIDKSLLIGARNFLDTALKNNIKNDFGSEVEFPYKNYELNQITLNKNLIKTVKSLLKTDDILLSQSTAWLKRSNEQNQNASSNNDQRMHMDFPNHNILVPSSFDRPDCVAIIIYLDDDLVGGLGGRTAIIPRNGPGDPAYQEQFSMSPGLSNIPWINDKIFAERYFFKNHIEIFKFRSELYKRAIEVPYNVGTILFYRHDVWHRGTPLYNAGSLSIGSSRAVINMVFKKRDAFHIHSWNKGPARSMYDHDCRDIGHFERLVVSLDENQRAVIGIPKLNDKYWTIDVIIQVLNRYNFDKNSVFYQDLEMMLRRSQSVLRHNKRLLSKI